MRLGTAEPMCTCSRGGTMEGRSEAVERGTSGELIGKNEERGREEEEEEERDVCMCMCMYV